MNYCILVFRKIRLEDTFVLLVINRPYTQYRTSRTVASESKMPPRNSIEAGNKERHSFMDGIVPLPMNLWRLGRAR